MGSGVGFGNDHSAAWILSWSFQNVALIKRRTAGDDVVVMLR